MARTISTGVIKFKNRIVVPGSCDVCCHSSPHSYKSKDLDITRNILSLKHNRLIHAEGHDSFTTTDYQIIILKKVLSLRF